MGQTRVFQNIAQRIELLAVIALRALIRRLLAVLHLFLDLVLQAQYLDVQLRQHEAAALEKRLETLEQVADEQHRQLNDVLDHKVEREVVKELIRQHNAFEEFEETVGDLGVGSRMVDYLGHKIIIRHIEQRKLVAIRCHRGNILA